VALGVEGVESRIEGWVVVASGADVGGCEEVEGLVMMRDRVGGKEIDISREPRELGLSWADSELLVLRC